MLPLTDGSGIGRLSDKVSSIFGEIWKEVTSKHCFHDLTWPVSILWSSRWFLERPHICRNNRSSPPSDSLVYL